MAQGEIQSLENHTMTLIQFRGHRLGGLRNPFVQSRQLMDLAEQE
jgi:hypothetical protein